MKRRSVLPLIERAVLVVMAPACGTSLIAPDGGSDASDDQTLGDAPDQADGNDAGLIDESAFVDIPVIPLPDGCIVTGKPDHFTPCGYTEALNDPVLCAVDIDAGTQESGVCFTLCDPTEPDCVYFSLGEAGAFLSCGPGCVGRLHESARVEALKVGHGGSCGETSAEYLARAAQLEAVSIDAFRILARDLTEHGAPRDLVRAARRAARDEIRHTRVIASLAKSAGATAWVTRSRSLRTGTRRSLRAVIIENAVEGCVRETYGVAVARWQSRHARDSAVSRAMRAITLDEARHADLAWRIDAWAMARLDARDRANVRQARRAAIAELEATVSKGSSCSAEGSVALGLPSPSQARALVRALRETVWA